MNDDEDVEVRKLQIYMRAILEFLQKRTLQKP